MQNRPLKRFCGLVPPLRLCALDMKLASVADHESSSDYGFDSINTISEATSFWSNKNLHKT